MNLHLTHEQQQIVESAEVFLSKASSMSQVRAHTQSTALMDESLWSAMSDLGWCGLHLPEEVGGLDLDWVSVCLKARAPPVRLQSEVMCQVSSPKSARSLKCVSKSPM